MKLNLLVFLSILSIFLQSCTLWNGEQKKTKPALSPEEQKKIDQYKAEVGLGRDLTGRLLQFYGSYGDEELIKYISSVGLHVANNSDFPDRKYMFAILDSDTVSAFACPGGYILISLGAIRHAKNEAELAMVLAHEIAHVGKQHMFKTITGMDPTTDTGDDKNKARSKKSLFLEIRKRPEPEADESAKMFSKYIAQTSGGAALSILQAAKAGMGLLLEKGLDKKLEFEADSEGTMYAVRSGYDPKALLQYLSRLEKVKAKQKKSQTYVLDKTHPSIKQRKNKLRKLLKKIEAKTIVGAEGSKRFNQYVKLLPKVKEK